MTPTTPSVGDPPSVAALFARHRLELVRLAVLLVDDVATAEDVVQDAFARLHRRWPELRDPTFALSYARTAVVNNARSVLRRRRLSRRLRVVHEPPVWSAEAAAMLGEDRREVMRALARLSPRRREVLVLRYYLDLPDHDIAAAMGVSATTVRSTVARALEALRAILGEES